MNLPPVAAASQTSWYNSLRDFARMIASLVALSAANMRDSRSFCSSARAFSSARSKLASANDTFSASRCNSAIISGLKVPNSLDRNTSAPIASPFLSNGNAAPDLLPLSRTTG